MPRPVRKRRHPKTNNESHINDQVKQIDQETIKEIHEIDSIGLKAAPVEARLNSPLADITNVLDTIHDSKEEFEYPIQNIEEEDPFGFIQVERKIKEFKRVQSDVPKNSSDKSIETESIELLVNEEDHVTEVSSSNSFMSLRDIVDSDDIAKSEAEPTALPDDPSLSHPQSKSKQNRSSRKNQRLPKSRQLTQLLPKRSNAKKNNDINNDPKPMGNDRFRTHEEENDPIEDIDSSSESRIKTKVKKKPVKGRKQLEMVKDSSRKISVNPGSEGRKQRMRMYDDLDKFNLVEELVYSGTPSEMWR